MPQVQDRSLDMFTCSAARYHYTTPASCKWGRFLIYDLVYWWILLDNSRKFDILLLRHFSMKAEQLPILVKLHFSLYKSVSKLVPVVEFYTFIHSFIIHLYIYSFIYVSIDSFSHSVINLVFNHLFIYSFTYSSIPLSIA